MCTFLMGSERGWLPRKPLPVGWGWGILEWLNSHVWPSHSSGGGKVLNVLPANLLTPEQSLSEANLQGQG